MKVATLFAFDLLDWSKELFIFDWPSGLSIGLLFTIVPSDFSSESDSDEADSSDEDSSSFSCPT